MQKHDARDKHRNRRQVAGGPIYDAHVGALEHGRKFDVAGEGHRAQDEQGTFHHRHAHRPLHHLHPPLAPVIFAHHHAQPRHEFDHQIGARHQRHDQARYGRLPKKRVSGISNKISSRVVKQRNQLLIIRYRWLQGR